MSRIDALQVLPGQAGAAPTSSHKRFNTLIRQIQQARQKLASWHENVAAYRRSHGEVLEPLQAELLAGQRSWVIALDAAIDRGRWAPADRDTLRDVLCDAAGELLVSRGDDPELKALFDKHSEIDFDSEQRDRIKTLKDLAEAMTGLDLGDEEGIDTDTDLFERMQQGMQEHLDAEQAERDAKKTGRRKSAAQARREAEAQQATQSVREVFRKLASALHPDRETDEQQRASKTALMQRANRAYQANDLLALLELQLEIEQIDAGHIANAGEQRVKHYNKVLGEQLAELKTEIEHVELNFLMEFSLPPDEKLNPLMLGHVIEQIRREWRAELDGQRRRLDMLGDPAATRRWLKRERKQQRASDLDFTQF